ncbi:hypothetical protein Rt10032_c04g1731 [Rhodotorula toruloides]|uniref:Uncharacterized protein n=1 Tax=Rhodotorula toruloides TaxID=5286 RepID=A0A511KE66_RHOTO|nr:hypothetical protein Rt10032_c04g1731 [Rhodotorula toruloides]
MPTRALLAGQSTLARSSSLALSTALKGFGRVRRATVLSSFGASRSNKAPPPMAFASADVLQPSWLRAELRSKGMQGRITL